MYCQGISKKTKNSAMKMAIFNVQFFRLVFRVLQASLWPDDATRAVLEQRRAQRRGEELLVAWSRSTSASSIYRYILNYKLQSQQFSFHSKWRCFICFFFLCTRILFCSLSLYFILKLKFNLVE